MTDIVKRLVALANGLGGTEEDDIMEGVAEIERLRAALTELRGVAFHNTILHGPTVLDFIDKALEPTPR